MWYCRSQLLLYNPPKRRLNPSYMPAKTNRGISRHNLLLHSILVWDLDDLGGGSAPVSDKLNLELGRGNTEQLQQTGLSRVKSLTLQAHLVWILERDLALDEGSWDLESSQLWLEGVGHWDVLLLWDLAAHGVNGSSWDGEGAGGWGASTSEISLGGLSEVFDDGLWSAVGEEETDVSGEVWRELVGVLLVSGLWGGSESLGHDLSLSEEKAFLHVSVCFSYIVLLLFLASSTEKAMLTESRTTLRGPS